MKASDALKAPEAWLRRAAAPQAREPRLRRAAAPQCLVAPTSRRRGVNSGCGIIDLRTEAIVHDGASDEYSLTIDQAEAWLGDPHKSISIANLYSANDT